MGDFYVNGNNGTSILVKNGNKEDKIFTSEGFYEELNSLCLYRGRIISISISIENWLNNAIEYLLFDVKDKSSERFANVFIGSGELTFHQKRKFFKELCKLRSGEKANYSREVMTDIKKCIENRNKLAHGTIYYDYVKKEFKIIRKDDGKNQEVTLTQSLIEQECRDLYECINKLNSLLTNSDLGTIKIKA